MASLIGYIRASGLNIILLIQANDRKLIVVVVSVDTAYKRNAQIEDLITNYL